MFSFVDAVFQRLPYIIYTTVSKCIYTYISFFEKLFGSSEVSVV